MEKWGEKGTARRLHTLADTIALLTRNLTRRHDDEMDVAIGEYKSDLEFLYGTYYVGNVWLRRALDSFNLDGGRHEP